MKKLVLLIFTFFCLYIQNVESVAVMSVDLGSEWMKIAIVSPGVPMEIILNTDSSRKTPIAVAFRDGERFIGDSALNVGVRFPEKTFTHFIDLLGKKSIQSVSVKKYLERFPYHTLVETDTGDIAFVLKDKGQEILYTPEELLSMLLSKARHYAEVASAASSPTGQAQTITDCVLTVPPYFSQMERQAIKHAAFLAGIKVLQLMNTNAAFALNYGVFRRKDFNASNPTNILFYDMGAGSTVASIASYQIVKTKERGFVESNPQLTIKGVGFDRYLGGFELQLRLREHLLQLFAEQSKKTMEEIRKNKRAMAKLLKEAGRLKKVLSANTEHKSQIENVMNDIDFKSVVTRELFETISADLIGERVTKPLDDLLKNSGITLAEIDSFIIVGGATRIPKIQQQLQAYISRELSKNVNADEAGALGAAYQAAHLSKGFKVKTFHLKDSNLFQINVDFVRQNENGAKTVSRTLFGRGNVYPQKKVITFNKHRADFDFTVNYADVVPQDSEKNLFQVSVKEVATIFEKYSTNSSVEPKGIKVHFRLDESGILLMEDTEALFEIEYEEIEEIANYEQLSGLVGDAISKFGSKLSSLFGSNEEGANDTALPEGELNGTAESQQAEANQTEPQQLNLTQLNNSAPVNETEKQYKKELKKKTIKEQLDSVVDSVGLITRSTEAISASQEKLKHLDEAELEKLKRDQAKNSLESFIHETRDKLEQNEYSEAATEEERSTIETDLKTVSEWLEYESDDSKAKLFEDKLQQLRELTKELFSRVHEHRERPEALAALNNILNISQMFYANAKKSGDEDQIFTEVELNNLQKLCDETHAWMVESVAEQESLPANANPNKLTLRAIAEKIAALDREVKYLLNKARLAPPKKKKEDELPKDNATESESPATNPTEEATTTGNNSEDTEERIDPSVSEKGEDIPPKTEL